MLIWFVVLYITVSVGIGLYASRRVKNTADYVVAGHHLPLPFIIATVFATWFGSETVLGIPAKFMAEGLQGVIADPFGSSMCLILVGLFFARPLYRYVAAAHRLLPAAHQRLPLSEPHSRLPPLPALLPCLHPYRPRRPRHAPPLPPEALLQWTPR
jgi:hypothetical protein